ncbi:MAG TPA: glycosyltransferase [Acidimicrobiales bacterium]|nr:glycosyltransferase [Acidimicrobiales bacterium]
MNGPPSASVVVPTRDRPDRLARCLLALDAQTEPALEVVVVDDGSRDPAAVEDAVGERARVRVVLAGGAGPAAARNLGAALAHGDVVCFTDDDCRPGPGWVSALTGAISGGAVAVAGPTRNGRPDDVWAAASQLVTNHLADTSRRVDAPFAPTSNLAVRRDVFDGLRFDESFPLAAGEDREWCDRLAAAGHRLAWAEAAWVDHHQELGARGFWAQQVRYGRGAAHLRRQGGHRVQRPRFYAGLLRRALAEGPAVAGAVIAGQVATAVGMAREQRADH